jgi:phosphoribosylaminoimidazole-succinocarboxamide synthase
MEKREQLYEGKAKKVFATDDPTLVLVSYKDDATAFNGLKKGTIAGKGEINNRVTNHLMRLLEKNGVPTHLVSELSPRETLVKKVQIVPLEVIVRNVAAGSLSKRLGLPEGTPMAKTVLEFCYKDDELGDPMVNRYHIAAMGWATDAEMETISAYALKVNRVLGDYLKDLNIELIDSSWCSAARPTAPSSWRTRSAPTPAASGTRSPTRSWIRIVSAAIWAAWRTLTTRS